MNRISTWIGGITLAHFTLWVGLVQLNELTDFRVAIVSYYWLSLPMIEVTIHYTPTPVPFWVISYSIGLLNSCIWGVVLGTVCYSISRMWCRYVA